MPRYGRKVDLTKYPLIDQKIVDELYQVGSWLADAVGDMAYEAVDCDDSWSNFPKRIKRLKKEGVRDIPGALADELYNDPDTVSDLCGDRICDAMSEAGFRWNDDSYKEVWNQAVDFFTTHVVTHVPSLNAKLKD